MRVVQFQYLYVGLPHLDALQYVRGDNWLGVALAALMRILPERVAWLGAEALRRITEAPLSEQGRFLLAECVQAYLPLNDEQQREYVRLVSSEPFAKVQQMNVTVFEKGLQQGREQARREMLQLLLEQRFGPLASEVQERLAALSADQVASLVPQVLTASSLTELGFTN